MGGAKIHRLKTWPSEFEAVQKGSKRFEYRRNDRDFAVSDVLILEKWDPAGGALGNTGTYIVPHEDLWCSVEFILEGRHGVPEGFCVMSIDPFRYVVDNEEKPLE